MPNVIPKWYQEKGWGVEEEEEGVFNAKAVNEVEAKRDRAREGESTSGEGSFFATGLCFTLRATTNRESCGCLLKFASRNNC